MSHTPKAGGTPVHSPVSSTGSVDRTDGIENKKNRARKTTAELNPRSHENGLPNYDPGKSPIAAGQHAANTNAENAIDEDVFASYDVDDLEAILRASTEPEPDKPDHVEQNYSKGDFDKIHDYYHVFDYEDGYLVNHDKEKFAFDVESGRVLNKNGEPVNPLNGEVVSKEDAKEFELNEAGTKLLLKRDETDATSLAGDTGDLDDLLDEIMDESGAEPKADMSPENVRNDSGDAPVDPDTTPPNSVNPPKQGAIEDEIEDDIADEIAAELFDLLGSLKTSATPNSNAALPTQHGDPSPDTNVNQAPTPAPLPANKNNGTLGDNRTPFPPTGASLPDNSFVTPSRPVPVDEPETTAEDVNLRLNLNADIRPFHKLDWVDRHFIWMHENPKAATAAWFSIVGTIMNGIARWRHGSNVDGKFAQTETPNGPINNIYFQDKQHDPSQSLRHAIRAIHGGPGDYTKEWFNTWRQEVADDNGKPAIDQIKLMLSDNENRPLSTLQWRLEKHSSSTAATNALQEKLKTATAALSHPDTDFALVGIDTKSRVSGGVSRDWLAFRKDPGSGKWAMLDASRYIIDAKNGYQPEKNPAAYLQEKLDNKKLLSNVSGFTIIHPKAREALFEPTDDGSLNFSDDHSVFGRSDLPTNDPYDFDHSPNALDSFAKQVDTTSFRAEFIDRAKAAVDTSVLSHNEKFQAAYDKYEGLRSVRNERMRHAATLTDDLKGLHQDLLRGKTANESVHLEKFNANLSLLNKLENNLSKWHDTLVEVPRNTNPADSKNDKATQAVDQLNCVYDMKVAVGADIARFTKLRDDLCKGG